MIIGSRYLLIEKPWQFFRFTSFHVSWENVRRICILRVYYTPLHDQLTVGDGHTPNLDQLRSWQLLFGRISTYNPSPCLNSLGAIAIYNATLFTLAAGLRVCSSLSLFYHFVAGRTLVRLPIRCFTSLHPTDKLTSCFDMFESRIPYQAITFWKRNTIAPWPI